MANTFIISRMDLKRALTMLGVSSKSIDELESNLNKMHRHVNAVAFAGMLQKIGLKYNDISNLLRRIGIDDVVISEVLNALDEEKIGASYGKVVEITLGK